MIKLMVLFKTPGTVSPEHFRAFLRDDFLPRFTAIALVKDHLQRAIHHHAIPAPIRDQDVTSIHLWAGAACYYFDSRVMAEALLNDVSYQQLFSDSKLLSHCVQLLVDEVWMYNHDHSLLPVKAFAFFKRQPQLSRLEALSYYQNEHATLGAKLNRNRTVRYIQNHVLLDYHNPDSRYDFDGGPEIWFKSMDIAMDLFSDQQAMAALAEDEAKFVLTDELVHFLTDEECVFEKNL